MFGILTAMALLAPSAQTAPNDISINIYLVAGNERPVHGTDWVTHPQTSVERMLQPMAKRSAEHKSPFLIIDGGDCSVFPRNSDPRGVEYIERNYSNYVSKSATATSRGATTNRVVERTETEGTSMGGVITKPFKDYGYTAQSFLLAKPLGVSNVAIAMQDLNSYVATIERGTSQAKETLPNTLLISGDSIEFTKQYLVDHHYDFGGVCICAYGLPRASAPNFVSFPPPGVVAHYTLTRIHDVWGIQLVEYLGSAKLDVQPKQ